MKEGCEDLPNSLTSIICLSSSHDTEVFSNFSLFGLSLKRKSEILSFSFFSYKEEYPENLTGMLDLFSSYEDFVNSFCNFVVFSCFIFFPQMKDSHHHQVRLII